MEYINGTLRILYIKNNSVFYPIGCLQDNGFAEAVEMLNTSVRTNKNGWVSSVPTNQNYSISFSGLETSDYIQTDKITYQDLKLIKRGRTLIDWKIDDGLGNAEFGQGYITELSDTATIDEFISFSGGIVGYGAPGSTFENIYNGYKDRVEADGGALSSTKCTKLFIENLLNT